MTSLQKRVEGDERSMPLRELTASTATPVATLVANLMPPEIIARRRLGWLKRRLAFALIALVALVGLGFGLVQQSTSAADDELAATQGQTSTLQSQLSTFNDILRVQGDTAQAKSRIAAVMAGDLQWSTLLTSLSRVAPAGVVVTDVAGETTTDQSAAAPQPGAYTGGGEPGVGTLDVTGTAKDYRSIATFVDALSRIKSFGSVEPGSLGNEGGRSTFTISLTITKSALGGRFSTTGAK